MSIEIFEMDQNSDDWHKARLGIPTSSSFAKVMAKGDGKTRSKYMRQLAGELLIGEPMQTYHNKHMDHGHEIEPQAKAAYELLTDRQINNVGFIRNGRKGASPDGLVGSDGVVEIKRQLPDILIETHQKDKVPSTHIAQIQGQMWVAEREWVDFLAFFPGMPMFTKRIYRDESYISNMAVEVGKFINDLDEVVHHMKSIQGL